MTNASAAQKQPAARDQGMTGSVILLIVGALCTLSLSLFFSGFGYWDFPGLLLMAVALGLIAVQACGLRSRGTLPAGLYLLLIGLAGLISFIGPIFLGLLQIFSVIVMAIGAILLIVALLRPKKNA